MAVIELLLPRSRKASPADSGSGSRRAVDGRAVARYVEYAWQPAKTAVPPTPPKERKDVSRHGIVVRPDSSTLAQIHVGQRHVHGDEACVLSSLASLSDATPHALAIYRERSRRQLPGGIKAGALLVHRHFPDLSIPQLVVPNRPRLRCKWRKDSSCVAPRRAAWPRK
jgi:hypothetical protein